MIRHFFKLAWNRRRANGLILAELIFSFLILCGVLTAVVYNLDQWRRPRGFDHADVWSLSVDPGRSADRSEADKQAIRDRVDRLAQELRNLPAVQHVCGYGYNVPFTRSTALNINYVHGVGEEIEVNETGVELKDVLGLEVIAGRWLEPGDGDLDWVPVVITRNYAELLFAGEDPVGRPLIEWNEEGQIEVPEEGQGEKRVVGVIADMRRRGDCAPTPRAEFRARPQASGETRPREPVGAFLLRLKPGTTAAFEVQLLQTAHGVAPDWHFEVTDLEDARRGLLRDTWLPLLMGGSVAGFLVIMVGMGLVGVLWQTVARRTRELGLRRALGATAAAVRGQVLGELLALTTVAVAVGGLIFIQLPLLHVFSQATFGTCLIALAIGVLVIYPFVVLCGLYPSWLATRVHPVQALQHE